MTTTTEERAKLPWVPALTYHVKSGTPCARCNTEIYPGTITLGVQDGGPVCEDCATALPDVGQPLWDLAEALDAIDMALYELPKQLRPGVLVAAMDTLQEIAEWFEKREALDQ